MPQHSSSTLDGRQPAQVGLLPTREEMALEWRIVSRMIVPVLLANVLVIASSFVTTEWVGRMGKNELAAAGLGGMTSSISLSVAIGLTSAVDTLASQAWGAGNKRRVGVVMQRGMWVVLAYAVPLAALWVSLEPLLVAARQPPAVAALAGQYLRAAAPGIVPMFWGHVVGHALMCTGRVSPLLVLMASAACAVALLCWVYVDVVALGFLGAPLALMASWVSSFVVLVAYAAATRAFADVWGGWTRESLREWPQYLALALPGILMTCSDWIAFEICGFFAGSLGAEALAAFSLLQQTLSLVFMVPVSFGLCVAARVGNNLGAGAPRRARAAVAVCLLGSVACVAVMVSVLAGVARWWGLVFTSDRAVVAGVAAGIPALCAMEALDSVQAVLSGVMKGCGMQRMGAAVNFVVFYVVCLPLSAVVALRLRWGVAGIFWTMGLGVALQLVVFAARIWTMDWEALAKQVADRERKRKEEALAFARALRNVNAASDDEASGAETPLMAESCPARD
eukprot:m51a1_g11357 hypothetical protein (509) ;mRNA; r:10715-12731